MNAVFGDGYAAAYDAIYKEKDYGAECDLLEEVFKSSSRQVRSVLDLGCGTGAHAVELAARGYNVVGVDNSDAMLSRARGRSRSSGVSLSFVRGDIRSIQLGRQFDAVICMFAVLGYQTSDADVLATLATVRSHLFEGGSFAFDVWYGPAVEAVGPTSRQKVVEMPGGTLVRTAVPTLDRNAHLCNVRYVLTATREGHPRTTVEEVHRMRYFFEDELRQFLLISDLSLTRLASFPETESPLGTNSWNAIGVVAG